MLCIAVIQQRSWQMCLPALSVFIFSLSFLTFKNTLACEIFYCVVFTFVSSCGDIDIYNTYICIYTHICRSTYVSIACIECCQFYLSCSLLCISIDCQKCIDQHITLIKINIIMFVMFWLSIDHYKAVSISLIIMFSEYQLQHQLYHTVVRKIIGVYASICEYLPR